MKKSVFVLVGALCLANSAVAWEYHERKDAIDDSDRSHIAPRNSDILSSNGDTFLIGFKCEFDGLNFMVSHKYLIGDSDDDIRVYLRFDRGEAQSYWWPLNVGNKITYADMSDVPGIVSAVKKSDRLTVRIVDPADGETMTSVFSLAGVTNSISKLSCAG